jgi:L-arabinose isomerase
MSVANQAEHTLLSLSQRPKVIALHPYWAFWEKAYPGDLRAEKAALLHRAVAAVPEVEFIATVLLDDVSACSKQLANVPAEAIVVIQSMAVPPALTTQILALRAELPIVVWAIHERDALSDDFGHSEITSEGATVGTPQLLNLLQRQRRRHAVVAGRLHDPECGKRVAHALRAAAAAGRLKRARLGRVGQPLAGYGCIDAEDHELSRALGIAVVRIETEALRQRYTRVTEARINAVTSEVRANFCIAPELEGSLGLSRSIQLAVTLEELDTELRLDMGAMNCHVPELRFSPDPGIAPCFALGRETSRGIPWSCTGDVLTPIAMLTTKLLAGSAIYHEIEALDYATNEALLANSGEHDLGWLPSAERPRLHRNPWFRADEVCGACATYTPSAGPATLLAFTPHAEEPSGFRFVAAEGELTQRPFRRTGTFNGAFRFAARGEPVDRAWLKWAEAGVNHHASLARGHLAFEVSLIARLLHVGFVQVT